VRRTPAAVLSAVTFVAAFGLSGCADTGVPSAAPTTSRAQATTSAPAAGPDVAPLPAPETLTRVLSTLADRAVPPGQKIGLIQYGTADDEPVLQNFADALAANGYDPLTVQAADLAWAAQPGNVTATMTLSAADPAIPPFAYPMEFSPMRAAWQLTRRTADQLLPLLTAPTAPR
jgi:hypothetical protein